MIDKWSLSQQKADSCVSSITLLHVTSQHTVMVGILWHHLTQATPSSTLRAQAGCQKCSLYLARAMANWNKWETTNTGVPGLLTGGRGGGGGLNSIFWFTQEIMDGRNSRMSTSAIHCVASALGSKVCRKQGWFGLPGSLFMNSASATNADD